MFDQPAPGEVHPDQRDVEFEVYREDWNDYRLEDGTLLRYRVILTKVIGRPTEEEGKEGRQFSFKTQTVTTSAYVPSRLKGSPDRNKYPPDELAKDSERLNFETVNEEWNEYVLPDKWRIRLKASVVEVRRSPKYNADGDPVYMVSTSNLVKIEPPE